VDTGLGIEWDKPANANKDAAFDVDGRCEKNTRFWMAV
jgi:hypothetical protein